MAESKSRRIGAGPIRYGSA